MSKIEETSGAGDKKLPLPKFERIFMINRRRKTYPSFEDILAKLSEKEEKK
ncbi:MAG: hypothetical protein WC887_02310 [Candidatus Paceibacterota bacterium]|jgi:hypothetical protein